MPFNFCVIKIPFPFALILLPCAKSQVALLKCPWGFPRPTALLSRPSDVGWELARPGPGSELSCCFDTLPPPSLSCLLPAVVIFLIRVMAFKSWFINKVLVSLIVDYFLFEWEKALVLAYLDEEPNLERICIEIAGFRKLLSDGKWSNFLVSPHYGYLANPPRQINGRALNSFIREMRGWESRREKWEKLLESPLVYCQALAQNPQSQKPHPSPNNFKYPISPNTVGHPTTIMFKENIINLFLRSIRRTYSRALEKGYRGTVRYEKA